MGTTFGRLFCKRCNGWVKASTPRPNHLLHFFLSLATLGIWLIVWFFMLFSSDWTCSECGSGVKGYAPPGWKPTTPRAEVAEKPKAAAKAPAEDDGPNVYVID